MTFPRGSAPNRPEDGKVFVANRFELVMATLPPGAVRQRLGEADDVTRPPTQTTAQPEHHQTEPGPRALSDAR
jgi:hypothetical protein